MRIGILPLDLEDEGALCERQAHAEFLDRATQYCSLTHATVEATVETPMLVAGQRVLYRLRISQSHFRGIHT